MRLVPCVIACVSLSLTADFLGALPAGAPTPSTESVAEDIGRLGDESFKVREEAMRKLWAMGSSISPQLREALKSSDPEVIKRARFVLRRIDFEIGPDTPPDVIELVDKFSHSPINERENVIKALAERRAWHQILRLYAVEKDATVRGKIRRLVGDSAILAAREAIAAGKSDDARGFLEMGPNDNQGLLPLAEFHRSHGTLKAELAKNHPPEGVDPESWLLALNRVSGDLATARHEAEAAGEKRLAATFAMLQGDPVPWLENAEPEGPQGLQNAYRDLAIKRWKGQPLTARDAEIFEPLVRAGDDDSRQLACGSLFLLGQVGPAEAALLKQSHVNAFLHYDLLERIPEALQALGLDPAKPDYAAWVRKHFKTLTNDADENEDKEEEILALAFFLERRGLSKELAAFDAPMAKLAEQDADAYLTLLGRLFGDRQSGGGAVSLAKRCTAVYAGDDDSKWEDVLVHAIGRYPQVGGWWKWMGELDPTATRAARLDGILTLFRIGNNPNNLRDQWLKRAWAAVTAAKKEDAEAKLQLLADLAVISKDAPTGLRAMDKLDIEPDYTVTFGNYMLFLSAANRWDRSAELWLKLVEKEPTRPEFHADAAASLRRAGKTAEAAEQDALADKLSLADPESCMKIGQAYAIGGDFTRASQWWERAVLIAAPGSELWQEALKSHGQERLDSNDWSRAAAIYEVMALAQNRYGSFGEETPALKLRLRVNADFSHALSRLATDREASLATLANCHKLLMADGSLADNFFPAVRKAGLIQQHDAWFELTWQMLSGVLKSYPDCDNTCNTAAWMAGRAVLHLDEAEKLVNKALANNPDQSAYLDTKAEIYFARKDRKQAVELSRQSLETEPFDEALRRQYNRYQNAPFPVP